MLSGPVFLERLNIINRCMAASMEESDPEAAISTFLRLLGEQIRTDRIVIFEVDRRGLVHATYEWAKEPSMSVKEKYRYLTDATYPLEWWDHFYDRIPLLVKDVGPYQKSDPERYRHIVENGIRRIVLCPIVIENESYGFVDFVNPDPDYMQAGTNLYMTDAQYIAVMLRHKRNVDLIVRNQQYDSLTGLFSMGYFARKNEPLLLRIKDDPEKEQWSVVFVDIPSFKIFNSENGNYKGNELLCEIAAVLKKELGNDNVSRFEADHFFMVIRDSLAEKFISRVHDHLLMGTDITTDIRAGIYRMDGSEKNILQACDRAMIAGDMAKGDYLHYFRRYQTDMGLSLTRASYLISHIDEAAARGWIKVNLQPVMGFISGKIVSFEALARWDDPVYGYMSPADFIGPLEENRLIWKLDLYVLKTVCRLLQKADNEDLRVSVNLSRSDFDLPDLHERINEILDSFKISHDRIFLEITESALVDYEEVIRRNIALFHQSGYQVWLDDFGSGYSSFNAIQDFDFDVLKIDMTFLKRQNSRTASILKGIISICKALGIKPLIEGVETEEQYEFMKSIGCCLAQGYLISKPLPAGEPVRQLLRQKHLEFENDRDWRFYEAIGRINVIESTDLYAGTAIGESGDRYAVSIIVKQGDRYQTIYMNEACHQWYVQMGLRKRVERDLFLTGSDSQNAFNIRRAAANLKAPGEMIDFAVSSITFKGSCRLSMIAKDGERSAYLLSSVKEDRKMVQLLNEEEQFMLDHFEEALSRGQFMLQYTPVTDLEDGSLHFLEASPFWEAPGKERLDPSTFSKVMWQGHMQHRLESYCLERVCSRLRAEGKQTDVIFTWASEDTFRYDPGHMNLNMMLEKFGIGHEQIGIRIRMEEIGKHPDFCGSYLRELRKDGYKVMICQAEEEGYFSTMPKNLEIDYYRLHRPLGGSRDKVSRLMLEGLIGIIRKLGIEPVAAGIRSEEDCRILKKAGCRLGSRV